MSDAFLMVFKLSCFPPLQRFDAKAGSMPGRLFPSPQLLATSFHLMTNELVTCLTQFRLFFFLEYVRNVLHVNKSIQTNVTPCYAFYDVS